MTDAPTPKDVKAAPPGTLVLDVDLDAQPETVWRAISVPALRERWLPGRDLADAEPVHSVPGEEVRYRMRDREPPFLESVVTFRVAPGSPAGTRLTIIHDLTDARVAGGAKAANGNRRPDMLAA